MKILKGKISLVDVSCILKSQSVFYSMAGMDVNMGIKGLGSLQPFIERITHAQTEYTIMSSLLYKMEHAEKMCRDMLRHGLREYMFI